MGDEGDEGDEGDGEVGRWGKSNSSFPPSPHPLIPPSSSHAQCPMPNAQCPMPNAPCPIQHCYNCSLGGSRWRQET
ncbi:MAG: hypothetical protein RMY29_019420 [Nostoc sp. CreGUA01]|nr:hypothetical protein [Nostoc sp. CreGUA01]